MHYDYRYLDDSIKVVDVVSSLVLSDIGKGQAQVWFSVLEKTFIVANVFFI